MTEKVNRIPSLTGNVKPVPMRLFAAWEVDRTPPNCVPRLCALTLSRLEVLKPLGSDLTSITLAVKMQSSKRTLRSNEISLPTNGLLDTELELSFALQYPHYLKQDGNKLQVMLQRRKRYKNRTILGFKTLATGVVNMALALQRQIDTELELYSESKEKNGAVAKVSVHSLSSQPVDHEEGTDRVKTLSMGDNTERNVDFRYSEEEEESTSNEDGSDSEPMVIEDRVVDRRPRKPSRSKILPPNARQRNLKQKFIALLKRFKITEDLQGLGHEAGGMDPNKLTGADLEMDPGDIEDLIDELEDLSDSGPEMDTLSVTSTPKPSLRPFFASSRSLAPDASMSSMLVNNSSMMHKGSVLDRHYSDESSKRADSDSHPEVWTDQEQSDPPPTTAVYTSALAASSPPRPTQEDKAKGGESRRSRLFNRERPSMSSLREKKGSTTTKDSGKETKDKDKDKLNETSPRKILLEQLSRTMPADDVIPDHVILVNGSDLMGCNLAARLVERQQRVICTGGGADVRATLGYIVNKIQKFCNYNAKAPPPIKTILVGSDSYVNSVLRAYVEQFSSKPPDWQNYIKFYVVPLGNGSNAFARYLASLDRYYSANILSDTWKDVPERTDKSSDVPVKSDVQEVIHRIGRCLTSNGPIRQIPIAEAMITYREPSSEEDSTQVFIPFLSEVRIGIADGALGSVDTEENQPIGMSMSTSGSPPQPMLPIVPPTQEKEREREKDKDKEKEKTEKEKLKITPPSSPNISAIYPNREFGGSWGAGSSSGESVELQVDYWLSASSAAARESAAVPTILSAAAQVVKKDKGECVKYSVKAGFRWIVVQRLPNYSDSSTSLFTMTFGLKEKKQKIMRLGKKKEKEKDSESKSQTVEGITRLVCQSKTHHSSLKVVIDGVEWNNVKFFQLSSQWQTHIRHFPVALIDSLY